MTTPTKSMADMTPAELCAAFPALPQKPIAAHTTEELVALKRFGPAVIGGALYLAAQAASAQSGDGRYGPAILSKGSETVVPLSLRDVPAPEPTKAPKGRKAA